MAGFFADFSVDAVVNGAAVKGILDNGYAEAVSGLVSGANLSLLCRAEDVPGVARNDGVNIGADDYTVASVEPDGTGMVTLLLLRA